MFKKIIKEIENEGHKVIFIGTVGSHLYGINTENSDKDYIGIFIPSDDYIFGLKHIEEIDKSIVDKLENGKNSKNAIDIKFYELRKFINLAIQNNPNILEILFIPDDMILYQTEEMKILFDNKYLFPHLGLYTKFMGYAISQKKKMIIKKDNYFELNKFKNLLEELIEQNKENGNLLITELKYKLSKEYQNIFKKDNVKIGDISFNNSVKIKKVLKQIKERLSKVGNREDLILKYGYDVKFASHLIRLLLEGQELLQTGKLEFPLKNRQLLLDIKNGKYSIQEILKLSENEETKMRIIKEKSNLNSKPQFNKINELTKTIIYDKIFN